MGFKREQFTFYRSFVRAAEQLPPKQRAEFLAAVIYYALDEIEPEKLSNAARATFEVVRPILDKARRKAQSGKTGGEASGENRKQTEAKPKQDESKSKQNESTGMSPVITGAETVTGTVTGTVAGADIMASPDGESQEAFVEVFGRLEQIGSIFDKDRPDVEAICNEYGTRAVIEAIDQAARKGAPRWPYVRAIVTSGGVRQRGGTRGGYIRHDNSPSPAMLAAVQEMLAWPDPEEQAP